MLRTTPKIDDPAMKPETYDKLLAALERVYPGKVRRSVDVFSGAMVKTIDNEIDALETIRRIEDAGK